MRIGGSKVNLLDLIIVVLLTLVAFSYAPAQTTSVTATITDTDGQTWNNGHWSATLYNPFPANPPSINGTPLTSAQLNLSGTISGSGVLTGTFSDNSFIAPTGTQWYITICANANIQCSTGLTSITGASANLSTLFSSYTKPIRIPASWQAYMYLDSEVYPIPVPGGRYWNVTNSELRCWTGSSWITCSGGGGSGCSISGITPGAVLFPNTDSTQCLGSDNITVNGVVGGVNGADTLIIKTPAIATGDDFNIELLSAVDPNDNESDFAPHLWQMNCTNSGTSSLGCGIALNASDSGRPDGTTGGFTPIQINMNATQSGNHPSYIGIEIDQSALEGVNAPNSSYIGENIDGPRHGTFSSIEGYDYLATFDASSNTVYSGFHSYDQQGGTIPANWCAFLSSDASISNIFASVDCGPAHVSTFGGEVDINGQTGVAGGDALLGGTSPNSGAPPTGYVGFTGPTTVTNNYWIPIPGTFPGTTNSAFSCSGTSSPLTCSWAPTIGSATAVDCLSISCAGGSTYVNGTTYTNSLTVPVTEEVVATLTGTSGTGGQYPISATVAGSTNVAASQIANVCSGSASLSFTVPAGSTFQIPTLTPLSTCSPAGTWAISAWHEIQW